MSPKSVSRDTSLANRRSVPTCQKGVLRGHFPDWAKKRSKDWVKKCPSLMECGVALKVNTLALNSYAKLNLYLKVLRKRKDGYHNIKTVFERISLADRIILKSRRDKKIKVTCNIASVPEDNTNLAWRSAKLLQDEFGIDKGVDIKIIKRIPVGSGMGGGSSNAASTLMGLNKLWKVNLAKGELAGLASNIGCDVPFFIYNTPFAIGQARGDKIKPLKALRNIRFWHILVVPKIGVSTPLIYKEWDKCFKNFKLTPLDRRGIVNANSYLTGLTSLNKRGILGKSSFLSGLTMPKDDVNILILALRKNNCSLIKDFLFNSLEPVTAKLYPQIKAVKERLAELGVKSILMSGSGPAVFGIVSSRKEALSLCRQLKADSRWRVFVTQTQ